MGERLPVVNYVLIVNLVKCRSSLKASDFLSGTIEFLDGLSRERWMWTPAWVTHVFSAHCCWINVSQEINLFWNIWFIFHLVCFAFLKTSYCYVNGISLFYHKYHKWFIHTSSLFPIVWQWFKPSVMEEELSALKRNWMCNLPEFRHFGTF